MKQKIRNALTSALVLAITAPDDERAAKAEEMVHHFASQLTEREIETCKRNALKKFVEEEKRKEKKLSSKLVMAIENKGGVLQPENKQYQHRIEVTGSTGSKYIIAQHKSNKFWSCGCMGFAKNRNCKHIDSFKSILDEIDEE